MKATLAIVCSLVLAWTPIVQARPEAARVVRCADAGCGCGRACCCAAPDSPESQPAPAAPASSSFQNQLLTLMPAVLAWALPAAPAARLSPGSVPLFPAAGAPLYARHCAFLL